ncbi:MAG: zinc/manganese transport system ATP-binding protein [Archaeoglobi archaeon]|nr:zinc/manganese transport system ATP-binding protein [Archaeoglobi archaeon]MDK2781178.1 zinc/manganese transport system ATP-binding protein [Archaeoglobi archaeon]
MRVKLRDVYVAYSGSRKPAISEVNLSIQSGIYLITGPNGAGKTTLLETILGLLKPFRGEARLLGVSTGSRKIFRVRRKCSYVPQDFMKPPAEAYTGLDVIKFGLIFNQDGTESAVKLARELEAVDLLEKPFGKLSGGQQQKIMMIRALARDPEVFLLDEPFSSLDRRSREKLCEILESYRERLILVVSHETSEIERIADGIIRMEAGKIVDIS